MKFTPKERLRIISELEVYIDREEYPSVSKFCTLQKLNKQRLYEWVKDDKGLGEYLKELIERVHQKQEAYIEEYAMLGKIPPSFAIFKLKQPCIGWTDKTDVGLSGGMKISIGLPQEFRNGD